MFLRREQGRGASKVSPKILFTASIEICILDLR